MTYTQIDLFNMVNKVKLERMFENWKSEMEGLEVIKAFDVHSLLQKFYGKGYLLGDFEIVNELKTLLQRFDIEVNLNKISDHQWEIRMPDYSQQESNELFVIKSLEEGYEHEFEFGNIKHALETYTILLNSGLTHEQLKFEVLVCNPKTKIYEFSHDLVVNTNKKEI